MEETEWIFQRWKRVIHAKTPFNPKDPNCVVSMTTSSKKEKRSDGKIDLKTITKILRINGTVEKVTQASVVDKDQAKRIEADTITITREKAIKQHEAASSKR